MDSDPIGPVSAPEEIHAFWFADALGDPARAGQRRDFWFKADPQIDEECRRRFAPALKAACEGSLAHWEREAHACVALVIVLDQFPRNIHRRTPDAFRCDAQALAVARRGLAAGYLDALAVPERAFLAMPFQHAENLAVQRESVALFERIVAKAPPEWKAFAGGSLEYARLHADIVERFGRFPHRNAILGRTSTPEETEYLETNAESFGQGG